MRTVKDFVKTLFLEGKSPKHIRAVAQCSHWKNNMEEVELWIKKGIKIMKKRKERKSKKSSSKHPKSRKLKIRRKSS